MPNRVFSIVALLFSNTILLGHAVVPHHYHEHTGACYIFHCMDSQEAHRHEHNDFHTHRHEGNPASDECTVDYAYTAADNTLKTACHPHIKCDCCQELYVAVTHNLQRGDFVDDAKTGIRFKPSLSFRYTDCILQSFGLRAPPIH